MPLEQLRTDYSTVKPRAERLKTALFHEIDQLLEAQGISLGVPLEARVKTWESLAEKLQRKSLALKAVADLDDLVGVRAILLFRSDLQTAIAAISNTFKVISIEDTGARLDDSQFGYQSQHLIVQLPTGWETIPSFKDLTDLRAEIQVRTVSQHIWAAASHKLQYKQEQNVPPPLRRTIYRISALLETVDLELDRVLEERRTYAEGAASASSKQPLNVDLLASVLDDFFPAINKSQTEDYSDLLGDLTALGIDNADQLRTVLKATKNAALKTDAERVKEELAAKTAPDHATLARIQKGVFYTHVGLARTALRHHFGRDVIDSLLLEKRKRQTPKQAPRRSAPKKRAEAKKGLP
jgi:putative GTP pyrophosphokinase